MLKLYNTLSRRKEVFKPIVDAKNSQANFGATKSKTAPTRRKQQDFVGAKVGIYVCGPTVYFFAHIGNHRAYVFADTLRRVLKLNNYKVKHVMNITDVGHLTSDQDEGEDKIEKEARKQRKTPRQIASFYEKDFFKDFDRLNNERPEVTPRATEHIKEMIEIIKKLEKRGYAYVGENGNVYFDTSKFEDYEKLAKLNLEELQAGTRLEIDKNKKHGL